MPIYSRSHSNTHAANRYLRSQSSGYWQILWEKSESHIITRYLVDESPGLVVDLAAGYGRVLALVAKHKRSAVGFDIAPEMLSIGKSRDHSLVFVRSDVRQIPLPSHCVDTAISLRFYLNAEPELARQALRETHRILRSGGRLLLNIHVNAQSPLGLAYTLAAITGVRPDLHTASTTSVTVLLHECGFQIEKVFTYGLFPRLGSFFPRWYCSLVVAGERWLARKNYCFRGTQCLMFIASRVEEIER